MTPWPGIVLGTMPWVGGVRALKIHSFIHSRQKILKICKIYSLSDFENCFKKTRKGEKGYWDRNRGSNLIGNSENASLTRKSGL